MITLKLFSRILKDLSYRLPNQFIKTHITSSFLVRSLLKNRYVLLFLRLVFSLEIFRNLNSTDYSGISHLYDNKIFPGGGDIFDKDIILLPTFES